jgi:two-component system phosphate regulon response regulator PhoB
MSKPKNRLLLIEPDMVLAQILTTVLVPKGYTVVHAFTAQEAIMKADLSTPDLVVLELQLVDHSGIEFLYEFRSYTDWENIPVMIYSSVPPAEFNHSREIMLNQLGVKNYLYKPDTSLVEFMRKLNSLIQRTDFHNEST